ncbi:MAG: hypothetical protein ACLFWD_02200 [Anaerolineales bacterium]
MKRRIWVPVIVLGIIALTAIACDLGFVEGIAGNIDQSTPFCESDTLTVTVELDVNDGACNEQCSLREAIIASNTCGGEQRIEIPGGTYTLRLRGSGDELGDLDITDHVVIQGASRSATVIEGVSSWNDRIFEVMEEINFEVNDLVIRGGNTDQDGGAILNHGYLTLNRVRLEDNTAARGGGLFSLHRAELSVVDFIGNTATSTDRTESGQFGDDWPAQFGDTSSCGGGLANQGYVRLENGTFEGNQAWAGGGLCNIDDPAGMQIFTSSFNGNQASHYGGGIANFGRMEVEGAEFIENQAYHGGGIYSLPLNRGYLSIQSAEMRANSAESGAGAFIGAGSFNLSDSIISDQRFIQLGGGIALRGPRQDFFEGGRHRAPWAVIERTAIVNNMSEDTYELGAAAGVYVGLASTVEMINVTISGNRSASDGALFILQDSIAELEHVTIVGNHSREQGGGILNGGFLSIHSSIVADNTFSNCLVGTYGEVQSRGYNIQEGNLCGFDADSDLTLTPHSPGVNGLLDYTLREIGGSFVHMIPISSLAFDRIPGEECRLSEDQVTSSRPEGEGCEPGAYEANLSAMSLQPTSEAAIGTPTPPAGSTPTVITDTLCGRGPGPLYEVVSSLAAGTEVEILGRGAEGDWWVIDNPRYQGVRCWAPGEDIEVQPNYDYPSTLFEIPALPTPTPTPILGCLWHDQNQAEVCYSIDQCPVDFGDSLGACTP